MIRTVDTEKVEFLGDFALTPLFWNCDCERDFIHPHA